VVSLPPESSTPEMIDKGLTAASWVRAGQPGSICQQIFYPPHPFGMPGSEVVSGRHRYWHWHLNSVALPSLSIHRVRDKRH